jgi:hypothetical protein
VKKLLLTTVLACAIAAPAAHAEPSGTVQGFLDQCERKQSDSWDRGMDTGYCDGLIEGVTSVLTGD